MKEITRPPLGVKPAWMIAEQRIAELNNAIDRQLKEEPDSMIKIRNICEYAREITSFCNIAMEFSRSIYD